MTLTDLTLLEKAEQIAKQLAWELGRSADDPHRVWADFPPGPRERAGKAAIALHEALTEIRAAVDSRLAKKGKRHA